MGDYRLRIEFWAVLGCLMLAGILVELVRRNRLKEKYSLLWFLTSAVLLVLTLKRNWLDVLARFVGIYYAPSALFLVLVFFMLMILVHFSTVISQLLQDKQRVVQEIALLEARIRDLESSAALTAKAASAAQESPIARLENQSSGEDPARKVR